MTLITCGLVTAVIGTWLGYVNARNALGTLAGGGDPTRVAIEASRPVVARELVRRFLRPVAKAGLWLVIAMCGLLMASLGGTPA